MSTGVKVAIGAAAAYLLFFRKSGAAVAGSSSTTPAGGGQPPPPAGFSLGQVAAQGGAWLAALAGGNASYGQGGSTYFGPGGTSTPAAQPPSWSPYEGDPGGPAGSIADPYQGTGPDDTSASNVGI